VNAATYHTLCAYGGIAVVAPHPWPVPAAIPFPFESAAAVYVVVDGEGRPCYVGSVRRGKGGLAERMAEHLADAAKAARWHSVWIIPLRADTLASEVRRLEGVIGAHLGPYASRRLPSPAIPRPASRAYGR
jgi:hypothetical protein